MSSYSALVPNIGILTLYPRALGHTQYTIWSTSSDKGLFALVGGKKIKNKIFCLARIGGKNKKNAGTLVFYRENRQIS